MRKKTVIGVHITIFALLVMYFIYISPLQVFDGDDWYFIGSMRSPFPMWGAWNPTRVLPEVLMPLSGYVGAFIIYPFNHNYIDSLSISDALLVSLIITIFIYCFYLVITERFKVNWKSGIVSELFFLVMFFFLYKKTNQPSYTGFWTNDLTCAFFYLIPGLVCGSIVMYILTSNKNFCDDLNSMGDLKIGFFLLILYFAIFSSTQFNILLATYSFLMLTNVVIKNRFNFKHFISSTWIYLIILFGWIISIFFDLHGQRAVGITNFNNTSLKEKIVYTINNCLNLMKLQNKYALMLSVVIIGLALIVSVINKDKAFLKLMIQSGICFLLTFIYLFMAYMKTGSDYANRPDAMWAVIYLFIFITSISFSWLLKAVPKFNLIAPIVVCLIALFSLNFNYRPVPSLCSPWPLKLTAINNRLYGYSPTTVKNIDNYIIDQVKKADNEGEKSVIVKVPYNKGVVKATEPTSNWPQPYYTSTWLQNTLYSHNIIRARIKITFKPDRSVNRKFPENPWNQQAHIAIEK